uniref:sprouty-related, EVH1 domain-containing protein 1-like isoform X2 n=1 Tax=Myxine glutinosa TaxID=7769 RepID=UPI00358EE6DD
MTRVGAGCLWLVEGSAWLVSTREWHRMSQPELCSASTGSDCGTVCEISMVRVRAVVMTRDDSSGGWVPLAGGGISMVGIYKRVAQDEPTRTLFRIYGERLRDSLVMLECLLAHDVVYNRVSPTFHHWQIHQKRFGLTFLSPSDAQTFDGALRKALEDLEQGARLLARGQSEKEPAEELLNTNGSSSESLASTLAVQQRRDDFWQRFGLPGESLHGSYFNTQPTDSYSTYHTLYPNDPPQQVVLPSRRFSRHVSFQEEAEVVRVSPRRDGWSTGYGDYRHALALRKQLDAEEPDAYVHFASKADGGKKHEYSYPFLEGSSCTKDSAVAVVGTQPVRSSGKRHDVESGEHLRCVYCREVFVRGENGRGRCQDAPDPMRTVIRRASCMWCAESVLYHCMSDSEGDYSEPCSCDAAEAGCCLRWLALSGLALLAPCMCCYPPLMMCHRCGERCGCCGARHKAIS